MKVKFEYDSPEEAAKATPDDREKALIRGLAEIYVEELVEEADKMNAGGAAGEDEDCFTSPRSLLEANDECGVEQPWDDGRITWAVLQLLEERGL